jgi:hypothetical protein
MARSVRKVSWFVTTILLASLGLTAPGVPTVAAQACDGTWNVVQSPNAGREVDDGLSSLAVVSPNDIWAVGNSGTYGAARSTLAEHWNGSTWSVTPTPDGPNDVNWLLGADAVASNNVWSVGFSATNPPEQSFRRTLIERWNGGSWSVVPSPNPTPPLSGGPVSNELFGVAAVSANDVWAVGQSVDFGAGRTLIVHWNGTGWSTVPSPSPGTYGWLRSVSALSASDVWAVGTHHVNGSQLTLIVHWNGSAWSVVPSPNDGPFTQELFRVRALSADDVWAVGYHLAVFGFNQVYQTTILHWNGSAWSVVPSPDVNQLSNYLWSVDGTSPNDAWAVGFFDTGNELQTMTQHWDGLSWTIVPSPNASTDIDELTDVAAVSPTDVWAVGQSFGFFTFDTFTLRRTGSCTLPTMHVSSIAPRFQARRNRVQATVTIVDAAGLRVAGASVTMVVTRPGGSQLTLTGTTDTQGRASVSTQVTASGTYTFTVSSVLKAGFTYDPAANAETSDRVVVPRRVR